MAKTSTELDPVAQAGAQFLADGLSQPAMEGAGSVLGSITPVARADEAAAFIQVPAQKAADDAFEAFQAMLDAMPHPAWLADEDGDVRRVNTRLSALVDEHAGNLFGPGWLQALHADDAPSAAVHWRASVASGLSFLAKLRLRLADGSHRWHSADAKRFRLPNGRAAWLATFTDIHDLVAAEQARQASQRRFEATVIHAPVGVAYTSPSGRFTYANDEFCRLVGYTETELKSLTWQAITHPDDIESDLALAREVLEGKRPFYLMDKRYVRKNGEPLYIRLFGNFIRDANGEVTEGLAVVLDLSDRRRAEIQQSEATRRRDEFLSMLAHELRNPLTPIRNSAALLRTHGGSEQVAVRAGQIIERQTAHLAALLDKLLEVARITRGRIVLERRECDLLELVDDVVLDHRDAAAARGLALSRRPTEARIALHADPVRVAQAISNLVDNALRFTDSGSVIISCERDEAAAMAVCRVTDTGRGMDEQTQARLFEPFAQARQGIDRSLGGLGVGLMITRSIVELHGGEARGSSPGPGLGSTFELRWPLRAGQ